MALAPPVVLSTFGATDASATNKKTAAKKKSYKKSTATTTTKAASTTTARAASTKRTTTASATHTKSVPATAGTKTAAVSTTGAKKSVSKSRPQVASYRRSGQLQPTPERYREIQQAMVDKGYFAGPVDGEWGASSVDALKRFQHDQNLTEDGKIGSVSLIALGLGPKRETPALTPPAPPPDTPQPTSIP
jgi:peptidoglycan hydrolase-like protein with peptidoglycan-binding domain